jgi:hypothetical protein
LCRIEPVLFDVLLRGAGIIHDRRQWLIQFVRQRGGHLAKQTDTAEKFDLLATAARFLFRFQPR